MQEGAEAANMHTHCNFKYCTFFFNVKTGMGGWRLLRLCGVEATKVEFSRTQDKDATAQQTSPLYGRQLVI